MNDYYSLLSHDNTSVKAITELDLAKNSMVVSIIIHKTTKIFAVDNNVMTSVRAFLRGKKSSKFASWSIFW